jgi:ribosomal protein S18 acetylase RimI-like enzyme
MDIRLYSAIDEDGVFSLMQVEGNAWKVYWGDLGIAKYKKALDNSIVYVVYEGDELCGYVRSKDDDGFGVYIYDLLVAKHHRGKHMGRHLMEAVCDHFPDSIVYVMSDVDEYYQKQGYQREGSILIVRDPSK